MKKTLPFVFIMFLLLLYFSGCTVLQNTSESEKIEGSNQSDVAGNDMSEHYEMTPLTSEIMKLEDGFSAVRYEGNYGFEDFLSGGGASSDKEVVSYLSEHLLSGLDLDFLGEFFGCSTIAAINPQGEALFGRNFDWDTCEAILERGGYLRRESLASDGRYKKLVLTEKTREMQEDILKRVYDYMRNMFSGIPEEDLIIFESVILRMAKNADR